jgi:hypothetical protein
MARMGRCSHPALYGIKKEPEKADSSKIWQRGRDSNPTRMAGNKGALAKKKAVALK